MPSSFTDVNFIPDEVVSNRKHATQLKSLNRIAVGLMIMSLLIGFGILGYNMYISSKVAGVEAEITTQNNRIDELNEFAESGHRLGNRLASIKDILTNRIHYWKILEVIYEEVPEGVTIDSMQVSDNGTINITGSSFPNYIPIALFQDNLSSSESGYFSDVRLKSASLDKTRGNVTYTLEFLVAVEKTYEPIQ